MSDNDDKYRQSIIDSRIPIDEYYESIIKKMDEFIWNAIRQENEETVTLGFGMMRELGVAYEKGFEALQQFELKHLITEEDIANVFKDLGFKVVKKGD